MPSPTDQFESREARSLELSPKEQLDSDISMLLLFLVGAVIEGNAAEAGPLRDAIAVRRDELRRYGGDPARMAEAHRQRDFRNAEHLLGRRLRRGEFQRMEWRGSGPTKRLYVYDRPVGA